MLQETESRVARENVTVETLDDLRVTQVFVEVLPLEEPDEDDE